MQVREHAVWERSFPVGYVLVDTTVAAHQPNATNPDLVDITVGTGVREEHS
ncbi:hypothetical protein [Streptomyces sp. TLI_105]|uniref:hypothetical protein n=1 Tax=Streptomyces sp. TLI_105 TaxID=1881019 RepID=UPI00089D2A50|nr:hypothetical protein [Streptomyces sp. TLI_105]SEE06167.1 hypothetical protein SAMN05428939_7203 [Streptomyces sp. TLI_105]